MGSPGEPPTASHVSLELENSEELAFSKDRAGVRVDFQCSQVRELGSPPHRHPDEVGQEEEGTQDP